jgi:hypothetical protein
MDTAVPVAAGKDNKGIWYLISALILALVAVCVILWYNGVFDSAPTAPTPQTGKGEEIEQLRSKSESEAPASTPTPADSWQNLESRLTPTPHSPQLGAGKDTNPLMPSTQNPHLIKGATYASAIKLRNGFMRSSMSGSRAIMNHDIRKVPKILEKTFSNHPIGGNSPWVASKYRTGI